MIEIMKKKKLAKKVRVLERKINKLSQAPEIKQIGFHYLSNPHDDNEYDDEGY